MASPALQERTSSASDGSKNSTDTTSSAHSPWHGGSKLATTGCTIEGTIGAASLAQTIAPAKQSSIAAGPRSQSQLCAASPMASTPSAPCNGPSAASYSVPPRPKPGRKPALDKPSEKRKAQNREAQRAFRERKVAHTEELRLELDQLKLQYDAVVLENSSLKRQLHDAQETQKVVEQQSQRQNQLISELQDQVRKYHEQEERWAKIERMHSDTQQRLKQYEEDATRRKDPLRRPSSSGFRQLPDEMALASIQQHSPLTPPQQSPVQEEAPCGDCARTGYCKCVEEFTVDLSSAAPITVGPSATAETAPHYDDLEMDFTSQTASKPSAPTAPTSHKESCGFCEDSSGCPCQTGVVHMAHASPPPTVQRADPMQISSIVEPGTCLKCQEDPDQRRFCIEVSKMRPLSQDLPDRTSNKRPRLDDGRPRTMTCNELYQASKHVVAESKRSGRSRPAEMESMFNSYTKAEVGRERKVEARPGMRYRTYSTLEIDGIETLAALSRTGPAS